MKVSGDGNCQVCSVMKQLCVMSWRSINFFFLLQFRALSDQMYKSPEYHKHVRKDVVKQVVTITIVNSQILFDGCILRGQNSICDPYNCLALFFSPGATRVLPKFNGSL